jgi:hypothetical protein
MMPQADINYLAVLACGIVFMVVGALWYSPLLFAKPWMKAMGKSQEEIQAMQQGVWKSYFVSLIGALVMAFVLAHIIDYVKADTALKGAQTGVWMWIGFVITSSLGGILFEGRPKALYFIYNGYQLVSLVLMGIILALWT